MAKNPFKMKQGNFEAPPGKSKGILDDYAVRKNIATISESVSELKIHQKEDINYAICIGESSDAPFALRSIASCSEGNLTGTRIDFFQNALEVVASAEEGVASANLLLIANKSTGEEEYIEIGHNYLNLVSEWGNININAMDCDASKILKLDADKNLVSSVAGTDYDFVWTRTGIILSPRTSGDSINLPGSTATISVGKTYSNHGGYANVLDLAGGIAMQRTSDTLANYLLAAFDTSGTVIGTVYQTNAAGNNSMQFKAYTASSTMDFYPANTNTFTLTGTSATIRTNLTLNQDNKAMYFGAGSDAEILFTGSAFRIRSNATTSTDQLILRAGTNGMTFEIGTTEQAILTSGLMTQKTDFIFEGEGNGLPYGSCYGNEITWTQASAAQNTWYNVSDTDMTDGQLNLVTHDGSGKLTISKAGRYLINYSASIACNIPNHHIEGGIEVNSSGSADNSGICSWYPQTANAEGIVNSTAILDLAANATIELCIRTATAGTPTLSINHLNITATMVGGT